ncbi:beta-N-acetylhexosaminidase [Clavibacter michiganensis]|uniref:beta-N-acetylhexosaminidase n=1 Tax=Clavibacter michiganensis TaxID=28447 RepID=A0A251YMX0_9MICO|nr:beta-N-acetylhexosaminidase [Clavibacter michiganensis]OUE25368.1 Beta-hexosaminidase [Clavibacter michiganensis]
MTTVPAVIPAPVSLVVGEGAFRLEPGTRIQAPDALAATVAWLQSALRPATGFPFASAGDAGAADGAISLALDPSLAPAAHRIDVTDRGVRIRGGDETAVFHACQTLLQLLPPEVLRRAPVAGVAWTVPAVAIEDAPRFRWRGAMLDVARHFLPKHDVLRFIDLMAMHKLSTLHWHLTDDQGWRVEIRRYPRLTEVGSWRAETQVGASEDSPGDGRPHGGWYTQDDIREVVAYAAARHIDVVPEIDVPGHSLAAIAAYPELGVGSADQPRAVHTRWGIIHDVLNMEESTLAFYRDVLDEVMELFPSRYVGIGGDECPRDQWAADPRTQELMRERGFTDELELQSWFIGGLDAHITAAGRTMYGWDEILEGEVSSSAVVASWRGMTGAVTAARRGHDVVACPDDQVYLDYRQSDGPDEPIPVSIPLTLEDVLAFEPVPDALTPEEAEHVLGGQANIWTEHMDSPRTIDYLVFPRLSALAEAVWSPRPEGARDVDDFHARLAVHLARLDAFGVEYRRASGPMPWQMRPGIVGRPATREERQAYIDGIVASIAE